MGPPSCPLHCRKVPGAALEHVFVLTLHLTGLGTFRPPLLSALPVVYRVCVRESVCVPCRFVSVESCVCVSVCVCAVGWLRLIRAVFLGLS